MTDPNGSAAGGQPGADGGAGAGGSAAPWFGADAGDDIKGFVETKGWAGPTDAIKSYRNLEQLLGADKAGRAVVWPKDDADTEGWKAIRARLGVPETPDAYKLQVPEGANDAFVKAVAPKMHELGLSAKQAQGLAEFVNGWEQQQSEAWEAEQKARTEQAVADFKAKLGPAYARTVDLGKRAAKLLGINDQQFAGLEETLGLEGTVNLFAAIGQKLGEDQFVGDGTPTGGDLSVAAAKARFEQLKADQGWMAKLMSGDRLAMEEKERLDANMLGMSLAEYRAAMGGRAA